jgi:lysophospholipase L1-like esterase
MFFSNLCNAQLLQRKFPDNIFSKHYHERLSEFKKQPICKGETIFLGNSITEGGDWAKLFNDSLVLNRGISGDMSAGIINRLDEIYKRQPNKVFLLIGINDLAHGVLPDSVIKNILFITRLLHQESPATQIFVQSILPVNDHFTKFSGHVKKKKEIIQVNQSLLDSAYNNPYTYVDLNSYFKDAEGNLKTEFTIDGLHLIEAGYLRWKELILDKVYPTPALIPMPTNVEWIHQTFSVKACAGIYTSTTSLQAEAIALQSALLQQGIHLPIVKSIVSGKKYIQLNLDSALKKQPSAYQLNVSINQVLLSGADSDGVYYGIQTLLQLLNSNQIQACIIQDKPSFSWRGYMIDVGRNYQSMQQIKKQLDVMARYKLNVFHLHLTEDIAWRLYSKKYPTLVDSKFMQRNKGQFYSLQNLKFLQNYCRSKHIQLLLEVDMPGHSAAFKRALGVDMQSSKGILICKEILNELCDQLDFEFIHIGSDEVQYKYPAFLNEMITELKKRGKKVVVWDPGGHVEPGTLLQMWNGKTKPKIGFPALDSRHLYLNHLDPLEGVASVFNHKIDDVLQGDSMHLGAILCNWPDRRVNEEQDLIRMNAVYPILLTFAERAWKGGGWGNYMAGFETPGTEHFFQFANFEKRLLAHKKQYFKNNSFPYVEQTNSSWSLIGPFNNKGNTNTSFYPELPNAWDSLKVSKMVVGGTIWLRHFWHPMIGSHLSQPTDSTTWYAKKIIWSKTDTNIKVWIGFNNFSRSTATHPPKIGQWDEKNSQVWVNGQLIPPPYWANANIKVNLETPLVDENYECRPPTIIHLKKGANKILLKCPVGSFKAEDGQNPVKWMFTFMPTDD